jgi:hypothetical protein
VVFRNAASLAVVEEAAIDQVIDSDLCSQRWPVINQVPIAARWI